MTNKIEKVEESKGYDVILKNLNSYFENNFEIRGIICTSDPTSLDFSLIVDLPNLKGMEIEVGGSGPSRMNRVGGDGFIEIVIPDVHGISRMHTKEMGAGLSEILYDDSIQFGASVDNPIRVKNYFELFLEYYQQL